MLIKSNCMKPLVIFIGLLISISSFGQTKHLEKKGNRYIFEGKEYKCKELGQVYSAYEVSLDLYDSGRSKKRVARNMSYIGIGIIGVGIGGGLIVGDIAGAVVAGLSIAGGVVLELIALAPRGIGNGKLRKARKEFNYEMIRRHGYKEDTSLIFGVTGNGMGLVYQF